MPIGIWGPGGWDIEAAIQGWRFFLPYTFEAVAKILETTGGAIEAVRITELSGDILYAHAQLHAGDKVENIDIRAGDAVALALRTGSPIYVAEPVLEQTSVLVPEMAPGEKPDDSMLVRVIEENRRRQVFNLDEVVDGIYISGARRMPGAADFRKLNITHVLRLHNPEVEWPKDLVVFDNRLDDSTFAPKERLDRGVAFVKEQRAAGNNVLIACWEGVSRSSTFVLAYLVDALGYDLRDAWRTLKTRHRKAWPARELWASLLTHYESPYTLADVMQWLNTPPEEIT